MTGVPPNSSSTPDTSGDGEGDAGTPRWVKVFGVIFIVVVIGVVILHLTGHGFGDHMQP